MSTMKNIFSKNGLTSSEANHITNITKELVKDLSVNSLALSTSSVLQNGERLPLDENTRRESWVADIQRTGELYALSAWLKSAIKLKETLLYSVERSRFNHNIVREELEDIPNQPSTEFENYLNQLNTKDRSEYLTAEAKAAHIGKFVHNFDTIRETSDNFVPTSFMKIGRSEQVATVQSARLYTKEELTEGFFELQKQHREAEKVVNLYKSRHKEWEKNLIQEHNNETRVIQNRNLEKTLKHNGQVEAARLEYENSKKDQKKEISALKIIVPNDLQATLDFVNEYAKK